MKKMIIELRINEYSMRDDNPNIPWSADEISETAARCRELGATVLHYHARNPDGSPDTSYEGNAEVIKKVREKCDILISPTLGFISNDSDPKGRIDTILKLAANQETCPDIVAIDPGTVNLEIYNEQNKTFDYVERTYINTMGTLLYYIEALKNTNIKIDFCCWDIGFVRRANLLMKLGYVKEPGYIQFHLTDGKYITGHPCTLNGLESFVSALSEGIRYEWKVNCLGGNLLNLAPYIVKRGGHLATGIGDYPYKELGAPSNEDVVRMAVDIAKENGREIATLEDTKEMLGIGY